MAQRDRWYNRPTGREASDYNVEKWSNAQRAWEFIRRSPEYQKCYDAAKAASSIEKRKRVSPSEFGLQRFVDYIWDWGKARKLFKIRLYGTNYVHPNKFERMSNAGKFCALFRINFRFARFDPRVLQFQLENIAKRSDQLLLQLQRRGRLSVTKGWAVTENRSEAWRTYLRLLDLKKSKVANKDIEELLYARPQQQPLTSKQRSDKIYLHWQEAKKLMRGGYIKFLIARRLKARA